jgi:phage terminase small subunit
MGKTPAAPRHLSAAAQAVWHATMADMEFSAVEAELLRMLLEQRDLAWSAWQEIARDGITVRTGDMLRVHPAVRVLQDAVKAFRLAAAQLGIELADDAVPVPALDIARRRADTKRGPQHVA